ncbi:MAG: hypothetical protein FWF44_01955 [Defluviitaleaceae bacterium]|nr:hypothetical protein [Defluviitaleaceae bacterium]
MRRFLLCGVLVMALLVMTLPVMACQTAWATEPVMAAGPEPAAGGGTAGGENPGNGVASGAALGVQTPDTASGAGISVSQTVPGNPGPNTASTAADLQAWFDAHQDSGGTVTLGGDIWLYPGDSLIADTTDSDNSITVNMGNHSIFVSGGELSLDGAITLEGGGDAPLISEVAKGSVSLSNRVDIEALDAGSCAMSVFGGAELYECTIYASGDNSTALIFKDDGVPGDTAEVAACDIETDGDYATCVYSGLAFYARGSSQIIASGNFAVSVNAPEVHVME